jgi:hypothetical protein
MLCVLILAIGTSTSALAKRNDAKTGGKIFGDKEKIDKGNGNAYGQARNVAPEIDPSSAVSALALLAGGVLLLRARRK